LKDLTESDVPINQIEDLQIHEDEDRVNFPIVDNANFSDEDIQRLSLVDPLADSSFYGCDIYANALSLCNM
jgi:hypothetical protein